MAYHRDDLTGIGGWLALLVFALMMGGPLATLMGVLIDLDPTNPLAADPRYRAFTITGCGLDMLICWFLGWRLVARRVPTTPAIVIWGLWISFALNMILSVGSTAVFEDADTAELLVVGAIGSVIAAIPNLLWTLYLLRSRRVANTYRVGEDRDDLGETFA